MQEKAYEKQQKELKALKAHGASKVIVHACMIVRMTMSSQAKAEEKAKTKLAQKSKKGKGMPEGDSDVWYPESSMCHV